MLPLSLFRVRNFGMGNIATAFIYGALSVGFFAITVFIQQSAGFSATLAGLAALPSTLIMLALSSWFGKLAGIHGPRLFMTVGPIVAGAGFALMTSASHDFNYWTNILPGIVLVGLGLAVTVAPLTSGILGAIDPARAGIGSAVNNAVSRVAGLVAVALVGIVAGGALDSDGFGRVVFVTAILMFVGGIVSFIGIRNPTAAPELATTGAP
jgi:predicted MFS family arabinose efflux permease